MRSTKMWYGIGLCATMGGAALMIDGSASGIDMFSPVSSAMAAGASEAGEGGESGPAENINDFPADLNKAMESIWAGEGGEGGAGMGRMWPSVRIPAMTSEQIKSVIPGNTLRNNYRIATYYAPDGKLEGWVSSYQELPSEKVKSVCTADVVKAREYFLEEDRCWKVINNPVTGSWNIDNHKLCTTLNAMGKTESSCWHVALVLDRIGLFDENGKMHKIGKVIMQGKVLGPTGDR